MFNYMLNVCMLGLWLGMYINCWDLEIIWTLRELIESFGLIISDVWYDFWGDDVKRDLRLCIYMYRSYVYAHLKPFRLIWCFDILIRTWLLKGIILELAYISMNVNVYGLIIDYEVDEDKCDYNWTDARTMYFSLDIIVHWVEIWYWRSNVHGLLCKNNQE